MSVLDVFALVVLAVLLLAAIVTLAELGALPARIAHARRHPQTDAIAVGGWLGLPKNLCPARRFGTTRRAYLQVSAGKRLHWSRSCFDPRNRSWTTANRRNGRTTGAECNLVDITAAPAFSSRPFRVKSFRLAANQ